MFAREKYFARVLIVVYIKLSQIAIIRLRHLNCQKSIVPKNRSLKKIIEFRIIHSTFCAAVDSTASSSATVFVSLTTSKHYDDKKIE